MPVGYPLTSVTRLRVAASNARWSVQEQACTITIQHHTSGQNKNN